QRFNGMNYADFVFVFLPGVEGRGFAGYLDGTTPKPTHTAASVAAAAAAASTAAGTNPSLLVSEPSTPIHSTNPFLEEYTMRAQWLKSAILNNVTNPLSLGLKTDGTPKELWDSL
ncbi:hypothetical protein B0H19DRAFT_897182, partial [Mycena capillaripes]